MEVTATISPFQKSWKYIYKDVDDLTGKEINIEIDNRTFKNLVKIHDLTIVKRELKGDTLTILYKELANTVLADAVFRPILFSTAMVQAILDGRKTQTRRIIKPQPSKQLFDVKMGYWSEEPENLKHPYVKGKYQVGDIMWVRETFEIVPIEMAAITENYSDVRKKIKYKADDGEAFIKWKPSIFMPKEACRIFLKVTNVRVERLQDISEQDAIAEGIEEIAKTTRQSIYKNYIPDDILGFAAPENSFKSLWESINGKESWNKNPWVFVYDFERIERPLGFC